MVKDKSSVAQIAGKGDHRIVGRPKGPPIAGEYKRTFADRLVRFREGHGYTRAQMAALLEIEKDTYRKYEEGVNEPPLYVLARLHIELNVSLDFLICGNRPATILPLKRRSAD